MWNAWTVRPANAASVSGDRERLVEPVGVDRQLGVVALADVERRRDLRRARRRRPRGSSATRRRRAAPPSTGCGSTDEPRTRSAALSGTASSAAQVAARPSAGLQPRFQTGPKSWISSVVMPPASAVVATCGESQCTCGSTAPGVTISPVASRIAVDGPEHDLDRRPSCRGCRRGRPRRRARR